MSKAGLTITAAVLLAASAFAGAASAQVGAAATAGARLATAAQSQQASDLMLVQNRRGSRRGGWSGRSFRGSAFRGAPRFHSRFAGSRFRGAPFRYRSYAYRRAILPGVALGLGAYYFYDDWCWDRRWVLTPGGWRRATVWVCY
jgi:hypothetical protein